MSMKFQSHNGAIAAQLDVRRHPSIPSFNPTMVRLLLGEVSYVRLNMSVVSIPQWCDCCANERLQSLTELLRFNPTMVRLLLEHNEVLT